MSAGGSLTIANCRIVTEAAVIDDGVVEVEGGRIRSFGPRGPASPRGGGALDAGGRFLSAGFIDLHVHGAAGEGFLGGDAVAARRIVAAHARRGTTGLCAVVGTAPLGEMRRAVAALGGLAAAGACPGLLGVGVEGPYLNPARCGAQPAASIRRPDREELLDLIAAGGGGVRIVTLAPELDGARGLVEALVSRGIVPSAGHSDATFEEARAAFAAGVRHVTHLFNAMSGTDHRRPGLAAAALLAGGVTAEIVADGVHLHPAAVALAARLKGDDLVLVTDCTEALDAPSPPPAGGRPVSVSGGAPRLDGGVLYGSVLTMNGAVRRFMRFTGAGLTEAVRAAALAPARVLGIEDRKGSIGRGKDADLVVFDERLEVAATVIGGTLVHGALDPVERRP
ncbi:MAG: N-acetylglucosamine-6-phosphate deacetylase [bacterium]|nr:N-acetylglucosamine-6-phosphate deacetylase [bacterium]